MTSRKTKKRGDQKAGSDTSPRGDQLNHNHLGINKQLVTVPVQIDGSTGSIGATYTKADIQSTAQPVGLTRFRMSEQYGQTESVRKESRFSDMVEMKKKLSTPESHNRTKQSLQSKSRTYSRLSKEDYISPSFQGSSVGQTISFPPASPIVEPLRNYMETEVVEDDEDGDIDTCRWDQLATHKHPNVKQNNQSPDSFNTPQIQQNNQDNSPQIAVNRISSEFAKKLAESLGPQVTGSSGSLSHGKTNPKFSLLPLKRRSSSAQDLRSSNEKASTIYEFGSQNPDFINIDAFSAKSPPRLAKKHTFVMRERQPSNVHQGVDNNQQIDLSNLENEPQQQNLQTIHKRNSSEPIEQLNILAEEQSKALGVNEPSPDEAADDEAGSDEEDYQDKSLSKDPNQNLEARSYHKSIATPFRPLVESSPRRFKGQSYTGPPQEIGHQQLLDPTSLLMIDSNEEECGTPRYPQHPSFQEKQMGRFHVTEKQDNIQRKSSLETETSGLHHQRQKKHISRGQRKNQRRDKSKQKVDKKTHKKEMDLIEKARNALFNNNRDISKSTRRHKREKQRQLPQMQPPFNHQYQHYSLPYQQPPQYLQQTPPYLLPMGYPHHQISDCYQLIDQVCAVNKQTIDEMLHSHRYFMSKLMESDSSRSSTSDKSGSQSDDPSYDIINKSLKELRYKKKRLQQKLQKYNNQI